MNKIKLFGALALAGVMMTSCSEEQTAFDVNNIPGKATVQGTVMYNEGTSVVDGKFVYDYKPAANLPVFVIVQNSSYDGNLAGETVFEGVTDETGKYAIEIPAPLRDALVEVRTADFTGVHKTVKRANNKITTEETNVVYGITSSCSVRSYSVTYCDMVCVERSAEDLPEGLVEYAQLKGTIGQNFEMYTPSKAVYDPETRDFLGYENATVDYCYTPAANVDLIFTVNYDGKEYTYNTTADSQGNYSLLIPVSEFPANFSYSVEVLPYNGNFTHYVAELREVSRDGVTYNVNEYTPVVLKGYYVQNSSASFTDGTLSYALSAVVNSVDVKAMVFEAFDGEETEGYNSSSFMGALPWMEELLKAAEEE